MSENDTPTRIDLFMRVLPGYATGEPEAVRIAMLLIYPEMEEEEDRPELIASVECWERGGEDADRDASDGEDADADEDGTPGGCAHARGTEGHDPPAEADEVAPEEPGGEDEVAPDAGE